MFEAFTHSIPPDFIKFLLVVVFSFLVGLEQRRQHIDVPVENLFGTDRTFTLLGVLGFVLYIISPQSLLPFLGGGFIVAGFLAVFYFQKIQLKEKFGLTSVIIALITYCLAPLVYTQPAWLVLLIVVCLLVLAEIKTTLLEFSRKVEIGEFITLAKFMVVAGVVLPLLPDKPVFEGIDITPYRCWLAVVVVSGLSYGSYLVKRFIFPDAGVLVTGLLGGLYSSTATTVILSRKSREQPTDPKIVGAIILAVTMMYLRVFLFALFFNLSLAMELLPSFAILTISSGLLAFYFVKKAVPVHIETTTTQPASNPLEFKTALVFAMLFIVFAIVTGYVIRYYGNKGVTLLSFVVGVTDVDPFILNLLQGKIAIANTVIVAAILNAVSSNNLFKMIWSASLADTSLRKKLIVAFSILIALGIILSVSMQFFNFG